MNRELAARNPRAADKYAADKVAESLTAERRLVVEEAPPEDGVQRSRARVAFLGIADELHQETTIEAAKWSERGKQLWES